MSVKQKTRLQRHLGRPKKYILPKNAYQDAIQRHLNPKRRGRPRRELFKSRREIGLSCIQCNKVKPVTEFWFANAKRLCLESMCRECKRKYMRERRNKQK